MSISRKIIVIFLLLTTTSISVVSLLFYYKARNNIQRKIILNVAEDHEEMSRRIDGIIKSCIIGVRSWSELVIPRVSLEYHRQQPLEVFLNRNIKAYGIYDAFIITDSSGDIFATNTYNWKENLRDYYANIILMPLRIVIPLDTVM